MKIQKVQFVIEIEGSEEDIKSFEDSIQEDVVCGVWDLKYEVKRLDP